MKDNTNTTPAPGRDALDELAERMLALGGFAEGTQDMKASEIKALLLPFFGQERIDRALDVICGRTTPEATTEFVGLSFRVGTKWLTIRVPKAQFDAAMADAVEVKPSLADAPNPRILIIDELAPYPPKPPAPAALRQYFYKNSYCPAYSSDDPECTCWHDEGTGPLADGSASNWRTRPAPTIPQPKPAGLGRNADLSPHEPKPAERPTPITDALQIAYRKAWSERNEKGAVDALLDSHDDLERQLAEVRDEHLAMTKRWRESCEQRERLAEALREIPSNARHVFTDEAGVIHPEAMQAIDYVEALANVTLDGLDGTDPIESLGKALAAVEGTKPNTQADRPQVRSGEGSDNQQPQP